MSSEHNPIESIMDTTMEKLKSMSEADTIIGEPINLPDGTTIIPISKVSLGFSSGGTDFPAKSINQKMFGGGTGAGLSITPIAFISAKDGDVKILQVYKESSTAERAIAMVPDLVDRLTAMFKKKDDEAEKA